jgi:hypothetical protein
VADPIPDPTSDPTPGRNEHLLPEDENANPVWLVPPRRLPLNPKRVANAEEENSRVPQGFAVTLVEDWVAAGASDAVHFVEDTPFSLDINVIVTYLISAVQHCHDGLARRVAREAELAAEIAQLQLRIGTLEAWRESLPPGLSTKEK